MSYAPNANWTAEAAKARQKPVYYLAVDGITTHHYSTGPVKSAGTTKKEILQVPTGGGSTIDPIGGLVSVASVKVTLIDNAGDATDLIATEASGAPVASLINRKCTLYAGYRALAETDYAPVFTGKVTSVRMSRGMTGYDLTLSAPTYNLDAEIMTAATDVKPSTITGNVVNVYWSILTGTFDTAHATFPLDTVSTDTGSSSVPTGIGIATSEINETQLVAQRDAWHPTTKVTAVFEDPESARGWLEQEIFRAFQCFPAISGDGLIGLSFHAPLSTSSSIAISEDEVLRVRSWRRDFSQHVNKFVYLGDYDPGADPEFPTTLYDTETSDDTSNQSTTGETIEYRIESKLLTTAQDGSTVCEALANRMRRYLTVPAEIDIELPFSLRRIEHGDRVSLTLSTLPNLLTGTRGVTGVGARVVRISPDFAKGAIRLGLIDYGASRFGTISASGTADYASATADEKASHCWVGATGTNQVGSGDAGYEVA